MPSVYSDSKCGFPVALQKEKIADETEIRGQDSESLSDGTTRTPAMIPAYTGKVGVVVRGMELYGATVAD